MVAKLPSINIEFVKKANTVIQRGDRGSIGLILKEAELANNKLKVTRESEIPSDLTEPNRELIRLCLVGNAGVLPLKVVLLVLNEENMLENILNEIEVDDIDYICYPDASEEEKETIKNRVILLRNEGIKVKFIVANSAADNEGIINFTTDNIVVGDATYTNAQYSARIAGIIASTPLTQSVTYVELEEVDAIPYMSKTDAEEAIANGELILFKQANVIRIARGVNSLVTLDSGQSSEFKKIKMVDIMDLIESDISEVLANNYIGKMSNNYDNKCVLIAAITNYLDELVKEELIEEEYTIDIDLDAQKEYLKSVGVEVSEMTDEEIKKANTGDKVFLIGAVTIVDAIEEIEINFTI